ncbi:MAG: ATP phosphoribosyltransferase [Spirochaetes bacterium]|nr:ATP phosphoribosyltransferase [Spirochaetota bacterium]
MLNDNKRVKFALPGKGRLKEPAIELLQKAGFKFRAKGRNLYATCTSDDITFIFVRADDIPLLVQKGVVDMGITGSDLIIERNADVKELLPLGFGRCRLCVAIKEDCGEGDHTFLEGATIATSFPRITESYFKRNNVNINIVQMNGSVEIMVALGLADAIVDIVETGDSLRDNQLKVFSDIGSYQTVLIANNDFAKQSQMTDLITRRVEGILVATRYTILEYNIDSKNLARAEAITPGYNSPTISPLEAAGSYAVKVMVKKEDVPAVMDQLEAIGATAIIESEIKNCRL